jgi:hypothetical protein
VGGVSASEEGFEGVVDVGFVEGVDEGLKVGEVLGEGGEVWVLGEDGVGLGLQLEHSVNGDGEKEVGREREKKERGRREKWGIFLLISEFAEEL